MSPAKRRPTWASFVTPRGAVVAVLATLTLMAWALASAPGSSPDDDYHLSSIWCARGEDDSRCVADAANDQVRSVPAEVSGVACFAFDGARSASCQNEFDEELTPDTSRDKGNWNGGYPPLFYSVMGLMVTDDLETSVLLMRALNALITVGMVACLALLLPRRMKVLATAPLLITSVPLGLFLFSSTNPSSWTVLSAATLWPALYAAFAADGRRYRALLVYALIAMLLGAGSRADGCLFTAMTVLIVLAMRFRLIATHHAALLTSVVCVAVSTFFFLGAGQSAALTTGLTTAQSSGVPWLELAVSNAQALPVIWFGSLGYGSMGGTGWLDTPFPVLVGIIALAVWVALVYAGWRDTWITKVLAIMVTGAALIVYPLVMLGRSGAAVGVEFQPRYVLPLLVLLTGMSMLHVNFAKIRLGLFQRVVVAVALSVAHALALHTQIRRYVSGLDVSGFDLNRRLEWWWGGPVSPVHVWLLGSLAFAAVCWFLLRSLGAPGMPDRIGVRHRKESAPAALPTRKRERNLTR